MRAIAEVKEDMERARPMDRLVCGDVGYGKTEVALRAAFKAVLDQRQVAVLVPTTVLALQHFNTFTERLRRLSGARRAALPLPLGEGAEQRCWHDLVDGKVDIVDRHAPAAAEGCRASTNLGLLVIDEEQRFGVAHKERLKQLRTEVDVLTLTATPIPRTLYMALVERPRHERDRDAAAGAPAHPHLHPRVRTTT